MIIPIPALWGRQRSTDPNERIDQVLYHRTHRLIAGLSIDAEFENVTGALIVAVGHGKFLRLRHAVEVTRPIPTAMARTCREVNGRNQVQISEFAPLLSELAEVQATVVEQIKCAAGKYVDRVLAVAVADPGIWSKDFDQKISYTSFCDADRLAELSGVNVIDAFPARDLAVGGSGSSLEAIPIWLLAADRSERVSQCQRFLLRTEPTPILYRLPASDGLDADVPAIERIEFTETKSMAQLIETVANQIQKYLSPEKQSNQADKKPNVSGVNSSYNSPDNDIWVSSPESTSADFILRLSERLRGVSGSASVQPFDQAGITSTALPAITAALLGLMHIDQMPANVPWLTGASSQRILGRLTPGRPSNWRQLIRVMADYQPAAMKLKDAV